MTLRVLRADGSDGDAWRALVARMPERLRDLHYFPDYGLIYRDTYGYEPFLAVYENAGNFVIHAFVERRLSDLPFLSGALEAEESYDIATPYGFGGPLCACPDAPDVDQLMRSFNRKFGAYCQEHRFAAEFTCLHPLLDNHMLMAHLPGIGLSAEKPVVYLDLTLSEDALWAAVARGARSSINRARRAGITVCPVEPGAEALAEFRALYLATMTRRGAAERWFFPEPYFASCVARLGSAGATLLFARHEGKLAAAYLMIHDERTAYYHFGASEPRYLDLRPNNLIMYETILWAKRRGLSRLHLGGGVTAAPEDSLLRFKSSFGGARAMLYTYGRIHHRATYDRFAEMKRAYERRVPGMEPGRDYFPLYRR